MPYVNIAFDEEEYKKIEVLKKEYGLKQTTELVRYLITDHYKKIKVSSEREKIKGE